MSKFASRYTPEYQARVGYINADPRLCFNSAELAAFAEHHKLLSDQATVFEIGAGACRNLAFLHGLNPNIRLYANDLHRDACFALMAPFIRDKVTFYESETHAMFDGMVPDYEIDVLISSDHLMHLDAESVDGVIHNIKHRWKPEHVLMRELVSMEGEDADRDFPRFCHTYALEDVYDLVDNQPCITDPKLYTLRLYRRAADA